MPKVRRKMCATLMVPRRSRGLFPHLRASICWFDLPYQDVAAFLHYFALPC